MKSVFACLLPAMLLAACSDDSTAPATTPPVTTPADDAGPAAPTGTLSLHVLDADLFTATDFPPLANANVAFYPPGGGAMMETTTDATGLANFSGIDWSSGNGTVVAYAQDRIAIILSNVNPDHVKDPVASPPIGSYDGLVFSLSTRVSKQPAPTTITGTVTKSDPTHYATIGTSAGRGYYQDSTATYSLTVPKSDAFTLLATEWKQETAPAIQSFFKWVKIDVPANTTTVNVDFSAATALTSAKVTRTFNLPGGAGGALGGSTGYLVTTLASTSAPLGYATSQQASADGATIAVGAEVIPDFPGNVITQNILSKADGSVSYLVEDGAPADGSTVDGFVAPPAFTFAAVRLGDPLTIAGAPANAQCLAEYYDTTDAYLIVGAYRDHNEDTTVTYTAPTKAQLPMALQAALSAKTLTGTFICQQQNDRLPVSQLIRHYSYSRSFNSAF